MRYWDSSALVPLVVHQESSESVREVLAEDPVVITWTTSEIEILSALCRLWREQSLDDVALQAANERLSSFWDTFDTVVAMDAVKRRARRLLRIHSLRAADALQLGAALLAASDDPSRWTFACLDQRLADAARREGFAVVP